MNAGAIEVMAEVVHKAYCNHLKSKGNEYWTKGDYSLLDDAAKQIDREIAIAVVQTLREQNRCDAMPFGHAIEAMKQGKKVKLPKWQDDVFISAQFPDENSKMTAPYFYVTSRFGCVPWIPTMIEMWSDEYQIVD